MAVDIGLTKAGLAKCYSEMDDSTLASEIRRRSILAALNPRWSQHDEALDLLMDECARRGNPDMYEDARRYL